jgi:SAM-dependent methyltransferase
MELRLREIDVPAHLQRNAGEVIQAGIENGGEILLAILARRLGVDDLSTLDVLDIGCGVRFTQTIINRRIPIRSYTGIDVSLEVVDWLKRHVEGHDDRFRYAHWNVHNALYNGDDSAFPMALATSLPVDTTFDVVCAFSVFTHLYPDDAEQLLRLMRKAVRPNGRLFFSALCHDPAVDKFRDVNPEIPLSEAHYSKQHIEALIEATGWRLLSHEGPSFFIADSFLCEPVRA